MDYNETDLVVRGALKNYEDADRAWAEAVRLGYRESHINQLLRRRHYAKLALDDAIAEAKDNGGVVLSAFEKAYKAAREAAAEHDTAVESLEEAKRHEKEMGRQLTLAYKRYYAAYEASDFQVHSRTGKDYDAAWDAHQAAQRHIAAAWRHVERTREAERAARADADREWDRVHAS